MDESQRRHQDLLHSIAELLVTRVQPGEFLGKTVPTVARLMADNLSAECVCIFFRRRTAKELERHGLAINDGGLVTNKGKDHYSFDYSYADKANTLLYTVSEGRKQNLNYSESEIRDPEVNQSIVAAFQSKLPSGQFKHLVIIRLHVGDDQIGGIRIINRLDQADGFRISAQERFDEQTFATVESIGAFLAIAFESYLKSEKLLALGDMFGDRHNSESDAIRACLRGLVSDKVDFPLAAWREFGDTRSSEVVLFETAAPRDGEATTQIRPENNLKLRPKQKLHDGDPNLTAIEINMESFPYARWAKANGLGAVYCRPFSLSYGRRCSLEIYASSIHDFDRLNEIVIDIHARILERTLSQIPSSPPARQVIWGRSQQFKDVLAMAATLANGSGPVLIQCETGTGKEILAHRVHQCSERGEKGMPFIAVNCSALNDNLQDSQLFGHEEGAFTGASRVHRGYFEQAHGGTLFLDEIGDIPPNQQGRFLRALEDKVIVRLGGSDFIPADVRIVAATNKPLLALVREGRFREDLYYRIKGAVIRLPPLRERREDIQDLAMGFLTNHVNKRKEQFSEKGFDDDALAALSRYDWPGNVRELKNTIESAAPFSSGREMSLQDLRNVIPTLDRQDNVSLRVFRKTLPSNLTKEERDSKVAQYVKQVVDTERSFAAAARVLEIDVRHVGRLLNPSGDKQERKAKRPKSNE